VSKEKAVDWSVLDMPGVIEIAEQAARKISEQYELTFEYDDAYQEALLILASKADMVREQVVGGHLGQLQFRLCQDLTDKVKTEAKHRTKHVSRERLIEDHKE
jgi:hypothetical protein